MESYKDRQIDNRQIDRWIDRQIDRQSIERWIYGVDSWIEIDRVQKKRQIDRAIERYISLQIDSLIDRQLRFNQSKVIGCQ